MNTVAYAADKNTTVTSYSGNLTVSLEDFNESD